MKPKIKGTISSKKHLRNKHVRAHQLLPSRFAHRALRRWCTAHSHGSQHIVLGIAVGLHQDRDQRLCHLHTQASMHTRVSTYPYQTFVDKNDNTGRCSTCHTCQRRAPTCIHTRPPTHLVKRRPGTGFHGQAGGQQLRQTWRAAGRRRSPWHPHRLPTGAMQIAWTGCCWCGGRSCRSRSCGGGRPCPDAADALSVSELKQDAAKGPDVSGGGQAAAGQDLRRGVGGRALHQGDNMRQGVKLRAALAGIQDQTTVLPPITVTITRLLTWNLLDACVWCSPMCTLSPKSATLATRGGAHSPASGERSGASARSQPPRHWASAVLQRRMFCAGGVLQLRWVCQGTFGVKPAGHSNECTRTKRHDECPSRVASARAASGSLLCVPRPCSPFLYFSACVGPHPPASPLPTGRHARCCGRVCDACRTPHPGPESAHTARRRRLPRRCPLRPSLRVKQ